MLMSMGADMEVEIRQALGRPDERISVGSLAGAGSRARAANSEYAAAEAAGVRLLQRGLDAVLFSKRAPLRPLAPPAARPSRRCPSHRCPSRRCTSR